jgi:hypothetical protein
LANAALSLAELHRLPFDAVAVEPGCVEDPRVERSVVALAETLEVSVRVARGVPLAVDELLATGWRSAA